MKTMTLSVTNSVGLSSQPVCTFIQRANQFHSQLHIDYQGQRVNAKSLLGVLSLNIPTGSQIVLTADGPDEAEALDQLSQLLQAL